ncbi:MAG TPA: phage baseplate upper protein, partial [Staphylococcus ureilyticus]|uniref:BppU family phage baseplate upper protein n=1 Tax=Staphylococcus ureilyticus TaxID=94138 RepID=UPI001DA03C2B
MDNGIDKKALFKMKTEPYLKPISDLGVGFYNLDENTAIIQFQLTNDSGPLMLHENNVSSYAYFKSKNGSSSDVIDLEIVDSYNGIVQITLPKDFLQASTDTKVTGQVYIAVNNVSGKAEYNEVAVFREFDFEVKDALINKISSFTKIEYIRMFDQLKARIEQQVKDIEEAIANGADYVAEMKSVLQKGIETLNTIVADGKTDIQSFITQAKSDLDNTKDDAINDITSISNNAKTSVNETADGVIKNINNVSHGATEHINGKVEEFNGLLETEGFLTPEELGTQLGELEWQKYKLTNDDGSVISMPVGTDMNKLGAGFYESSGFINDPLNDEGFYEVIVTESKNSRKVIYATHSYSNRMFVKTFHSGGAERNWKELTNSTSDTGWVTFDLINGAKQNTAYKGEIDVGFDCAYRTITNGSEITKKLRINGSNLTPNQVIAQLPKNFAKETQAFPVRVPNSSTGGYIVIRPSGRVNFYVSGDTSNWNETGYAYGECTWHD